MITSKGQITQENLEMELVRLAERLELDSLEEAFYFPKYYQVETVRVCNARCPFCAIDQWDKSHPLMSDQLFEKIAIELSVYADWINMVSVQRAGEPLLDKKIGQRVHILKEGGIKNVSMATNVSMLTEKKAVELLEAGLDEILLSIDSIDKENYEKMRVRLKYETVMHNIETLFKAREAINPKMIVRVRGVSLYDLNQEEERRELVRWEDFWEKFRKPHDRIYMKQAHNWGNQIQLDERTDQELDGSYGDVYHPCILPWSTMHITAMGTVALCPQDYDAKLNLGDINHESIAQVWKNKKWAWVRSLHQSGNRNAIKFCQGCKLFDQDFSLEKKDEEKKLYES